MEFNILTILIGSSSIFYIQFNSIQYFFLYFPDGDDEWKRRTQQGACLPNPIVANVYYVIGFVNLCVPIQGVVQTLDDSDGGVALLCGPDHSASLTSGATGVTLERANDGYAAVATSTCV